ncbi:outer membrane protein OmpA-like peptidoglycan-associated protein [Loktanella ponticola]|uniref:Outer membrane protein OmpA-like peptidoglycan-associated protein n=1 Tax=Yoonia ponticola TaxID=1524255 RepID=A0A7W9EYZ8_9RHOB|nr:OmpA family protein [Yoonia ponticola]MBB5723219.1 outer membrane protein OmpA-like peptidoglycan-associated protein [Yoonia ponticola]
MSHKSFKMTTAIAACLSITAPAPIWAQEAGDSFPCVAPDGAEVTDPTMLSEALMTYLVVGTRSDDFGSCDAVAVQSALEVGGEDLGAALANAPGELQAQLPDADGIVAVGEAEAVADAVPMTEVEADIEAETESATDVEAEAETEVTPEVEAASDAQTTPEAAPESEPGVASTAEAEVEAEADVAPELETEAEADAEVETDKLADALAEEAEPVEGTSEAAPQADQDAGADDVGADEPSATDAAPVEDTASDESVDAIEDTSAEIPDEIDDTAETGDTNEVNDAEIADVADGAGEAGSEQLTDEERQTLNQERESEAVIASPSAAAGDDGENAEEAEAEVETEVVAENDVRRSDEDFATAAVGDAQVTEDDKDDGGPSNFEKALLLGLGAAVVGSVLNNGDQVVSNSGDRVIIERDGELRVLKNDDVLLRRPGAQVQTQTFNDGSTRSVLAYEDGSQIITVRANDGTVLRRTLIRAQDGTEVVLFDDTQVAEPIEFSELPAVEARKDVQSIDTSNQAALRDALQAALLADVNRQFSLQQIRDFKRVRNLAPEVELDQITFATGSAAIQPAQAEELRALGLSMVNIIETNPQAVFLVEGHTDAVGSASYNLSLSDRRAETVALALTEYFGVPPQNLITQGYGETDLKIEVLTDERANRRASVRNITRLLNRS